jgi:hypothetical protein
MPWLLIIGAVVLVGLIVTLFIIAPFSRPPFRPRATPLIITAAATSAHSIRLTLEKGPGPVEVELERSSAPDPSPVSLFTLFSTYDDKNLLPDTFYSYRTRFSNPQSDWSPPKNAKTLFNALPPGELVLSETGWQGLCIVQRFEANVLSRSGNVVSITLRVPATGISIERIYISPADPAPGMDPYDSSDYLGAFHDTDTTPALVVPPSPTNQSQTVTLPVISYGVDHTRPLLIAIELSASPPSSIMYKPVPPETAVAYYKPQGPLQPGEQPEARKTDRDGYSRWPAAPTQGGIYLVETIEVG